MKCTEENSQFRQEKRGKNQHGKRMQMGILAYLLEFNGSPREKHY